MSFLNSFPLKNISFSKRDRGIGGITSLGVVVILVLGFGGKWGFADHLSKAILFFSAFFVLRHFRFKNILRHPASPWAMALCVWYFVAAFFSSSLTVSWTAVVGVWSIVILSMVGLLTWKSPHRLFLEGLVAFVVLLQTIFLLLGKFLVVPPLLVFPGNPQYVSFWLCAGFFLALARYFESPFFLKGEGVQKNVRRGVYLIVVVAAVVGVLLLPVRSSYLALFVGALVFGWVRFGRRGLLVVGFVFVFLLTILPQPVFENRIKTHDSRSYKRIDIWKSAFSALIDRPFFGWGPGKFENAYWVHEIPQNSDAVHFEMSTDRAHNELLQVFVETGIPGGVLALLCLVGVWNSFPQGSLSSGIKAAWAATTAFSMVNSPLVLPACGALFGLLVALAPPGRWVRDRSFLTSPKTGFRNLGLILLLLVGMGEFALALNEIIGSHRSQFLDSTNGREVEARRERAFHQLHLNSVKEESHGVAELRGLLRWNPHRAELWRDLAHSELDHRRPPDPEKAIVHYHKALSLRPHHAPWWVELGGVLVRKGDLPGALRAVRESFRLEPYYFDAMVSYGNLLRMDGRPQEALRWLDVLREKSESWPSFVSSDSGYRRTVLHRDENALEKTTALCQMDLKKYTEALGTLERIDPRDFERQSLEVGCLFFLGRIKEAERKIISAQLNDPEDSRWDEMLQRVREHPTAP
ncbi:MAG: O-antigen ligase family protein [Elusimicrobia bacterium]|nr:O-antigen ligase family protein [Elusimicrobiota bacterium]